MDKDVVLHNLRTIGLAMLWDNMPGFDAFRSYLSMRPLYENHVRQGKPEAGPLGSHPYMCHDPQDVVRAPALLEQAIKLADVAEAYLGTIPVLYSLNAFYCEPGTTPKPDIQDWHRDSDDVRFLALFVYGTDVLTDQDGPHQLMYDERNRYHINAFGTAGTMFLADTRKLHRGLVPQRSRRMMAWARWGVSAKPAAYVWDGLSPIPRAELGDRYPTDPRQQRLIELLVK